MQRVCVPPPPPPELAAAIAALAPEVAWAVAVLPVVAVAGGATGPGPVGARQRVALRGGAADLRQSRVRRRRRCGRTHDHVVLDGRTAPVRVGHGEHGVLRARVTERVVDALARSKWPRAAAGRIVRPCVGAWSRRTGRA